MNTCVASEYTKGGIDSIEDRPSICPMEWFERAKKIMKAKGIVQDDLIPVFGVQTRGAVSHYMTGKRQPDPKQLVALADKLGCSLDELFGRREIDPIHNRIGQILAIAKTAIKQSGLTFSDDELMRIYRVAIDAGYSNKISDHDLKMHMVWMLTHQSQ